MLNEAGYLVIVVSNQSGVARGYYDISVAEATNRRLNELLEEEGAHIDAFYICPHHPEGAVKEYAVRCDCRKPGTALFERAIRDFGLDPSRCYACGDRARDVERLTAENEYGMLRISRKEDTAIDNTSGKIEPLVYELVK